MSIMKIGTTVYDTNQDRIDIRFTNGETYGGIHCGECLDILLNGEWISTRIEMEQKWFLVGLEGISPIGQTVRI